VQDLLDGLPFEDASVSEVVAQDILEHFIYDDFLYVVSEIARVLKDGGELYVRVPNVDAIVEQFEDDKEVRNIFLYGSTAHRTDTGVFGAHKIGFTRTRLVAECLVYGLTPRSVEEVGTNFEAVFVKIEPLNVSSLLFLNQALSIGGAEVFDADILSALKMKADIHIAAFTNHSFFAHMLEYRDITALQVPWVVDLIGNVRGLVKALVFAPLLTFWYAVTLWKYRHVDVLMLSGFTEKVLATPWAYLFNIPTVWIEFGPLHSVFSKLFGIPKILYRLVVGLPDRVIVPSHNTMEDLLTSARISLAKMEAIPCGSALQPVKKFADVKAPIIVCASRLENGKGQDILLRAFKDVIKKVPGAKLHIIGEGDFLEELQQLVEELKLEKTVSFLGRVQSVREHMQAAQLVVFPSLWTLEGFGLVTIEAMALAKPVVAFNRGPTNEIVIDGETGILAKEHSPQALASAILTLMKSPKKRKEYGEAGLKRFNKIYTINQTATAYKNVLVKALAWNKARQVAKETH
ncbi:MAG: glycosyltransferase, partial [Pseudomonadales bacterium]|nr:glycosyltransferase [Pseudomonadales bacterium]